MPLEGHWERQQAPLRTLSVKEKRVLLIGAVLAVALLLSVVLGALANVSPSVSNGCHREVVATSTGGASVERCPTR